MGTGIKLVTNSNVFIVNVLFKKRANYSSSLGMKV